MEDRTTFRLDAGLEELAGLSLKKRKPEIWKSITRLHKLRNDLIHQGRVSKSHQLPTYKELQGLIDHAWDAAQIVQSLFPPELQLWPGPHRRTHVSFVLPEVSESHVVHWREV